MGLVSNTSACLQVFLGTLREAEIERINDRISQAVMETCLAMTIFRDEFNIEFVAMFTALTFVKIFHWLIQDRVDYIETTPNISRFQHFRILSFFFVLLVCIVSPVHLYSCYIVFFAKCAIFQNRLRSSLASSSIGSSLVCIAVPLGYCW